MANHSSSPKNEFIHSNVLSFKFPEKIFTYTERDAAIYALGVGSCNRNAVEPPDLKYLYHEGGQDHIKVLPTFSTVFTGGSIINELHLPGFKYDPKLLLHGQQYIEFYRPLPSAATTKSITSIAGLHDKGKAAIVELEIKSFDTNSDELLCMNRFTLYLRGAGGFSTTSKPYSYSTYSSNQVASVKIPKGNCFAAYEDYTHNSQALLYRLSGDYNPLHADPKIAKVARFSGPILHGLCTLGFAARAIIRCVCRGDESLMKNILGRFLLHVFPGETLITEMWLEGSRIIYQTKVKERNRPVLSGYADLHCIPSSL